MSSNSRTISAPASTARGVVDVRILDHDIDRLRDAAEVAGRPHLQLVVSNRAHHDHAAIERELGMGNRVVGTRNDMKFSLKPKAFLSHSIAAGASR